MQNSTVPLSPLSFLNRSAEVFPEKTAVVTDAGEHITYRALRGRSNRLARALARDGIAAGDRVAVLAANDIELLEAHFGVPAAGAVLVALNTRLAPREYDYILEHSGARVLVFDDRHVDIVAQLSPTLRDRLQLVAVGAGSARRSGAVAYDSWLHEDGVGRLPLPDDEHDPISINYTSGTTGRPKGAVYSHRGAYLNALSVALGLRLGPESRYLWTLPMFHCNGWCFTWGVAAVGAVNVCLGKFDAERALALMVEHDVTHLCGAPVVLAALADAATDDSQRPRRRVVAATGGAPPSPTLLERMDALGIDVIHLYGLTETYGPSLICEMQPTWYDLGPTDRAEVMSRQGVPTLSVEGVRVVGDDMQDVPDDGASIGEIIVRSNTVMMRYLDDDAATGSAITEGWLRTGDLGVRHPDGYIEVRDRAKDIIISGGENISSIEVENVIVAHPAVAEAAVVGRADERWGEVPVAHVALQPGETASSGEIIDWVRDRLAHFKAPKDVIFEQLPKTSTGKIRKAELRARNEAEPDI